MEPKFPTFEYKRESGEPQEKDDRLETLLDDTLSRRDFFEAVRSTEYESASEEYEKLRAVNAWRRQAAQSQAREFYSLVERFSLVQEVNVSSEDRLVMRELLADRLSANVPRLGPKVGDLYAAMLAELDGSVYEPRFDLTRRKIDEMRSTNDLEYLASPSVSMESKSAYLAKRFDAYVAGLNQLDGFEDRRKQEAMSEDEREERRKKLENMPSRPVERQNESRPGVDPMERLKEGERAPALWSIQPPYGGYFREQSFSRWDENRKMWMEPEYTYTDAVFVPLLEISKQTEERFNITMSATVSANRWISLSVPYTHDIAEVKAGGKNISIKKDQNGDAVIYVSGKDGEVFDVSVSLASVSRKTYAGKPSVPEMEGVFSSETENALKRIGFEKSGNFARALAAASYVRGRVRYLAPKDAAEAETYNQSYRSHANGFAGAVDELRAADCDVANTYFAALCARLSVPVRHVVGHSVKGRDMTTNTSQIHSGTGHAWSEIWDEKALEWVRIDATPSGDPQLEEERQFGNESVPGDYGEQEAVGPTDEELAKLEEELSKHVEELSYTPAERKLAEDTGIELKEAREIVREIEAAENTRLPNGRRITDALSQLFDMIVESRKAFSQEYTGPLRRRDGGEHIDDIVRHYIGTVAGESDPLSRAKEKNVTKEEKLMSGFDVHLIGDKSGSMSQTVDGEAKWEMQRRALYLILSSLHRFEEKLKRSGVSAIAGKELDVRTESLSFRGENEEDLDTDKPLSTRFESADKVRLWRSLTEQGGGNGDVIALQTIYHEIAEEIKVAEAGRKKKDRLRIVIAMTDGSPDSVTGVHTEAARLGKLGAVVVGVGLTETAKAVKQIYTTEWSKGDYVESIEDLPAVVAKYVILEAMKLFPEKAREQNRQALDMMLREFGKTAEN